MVDHRNVIGPFRSVILLDINDILIFMLISEDNKREQGMSYDLQ